MNEQTNNQYLFIVYDFDNNAGSGGIGTYYRELVQYLSKINIKTKVITYSKKNKSLKDGSIIYINELATPFLFLLFSIFLARNNIFNRHIVAWYCACIKYIYLHRRELQEYQIEVSDSLSMGFFLNSLNLPYRIKIHTPNYFIYKLNGWPLSLLVQIVGFFEKKSIDFASKIMSPSKAMADFLIKEKWLKVNRDYVKLPNYLIEQKSMTFNEFANKTNSIIFISNLQERKGLRVLVEAFQHIRRLYPDIKLQIFGRDELIYKNKTYYSYLSDLKKNYSFENIEYNNYCCNLAIKEYLRNAMILVYPSLCFENYPMTILESIACYCYPLVSNVCGFIELFKSMEVMDNFIIKPDTNSIIAKIKMVINMNNYERYEMLNKLQKNIYFNKQIIGQYYHEWK